MLTKLYNKNDNDANGIEAHCGEFWAGHYNYHGVWTNHPIRCGTCDDCLDRTAAATKKRISKRIEIRAIGNEALVVSMRLNVDSGKIIAFQKRLQRDETARYYRTINEAGGYDYIIQSETVYSSTIDEIDYDFRAAARTSKENGKRQTGLLYSQKSKKVVSQKEDTYSLNTTKITARRASDSKRIAVIAKSILPDTLALNAKEHQARIYSLTTRLTNALNDADISYRTEAIIGRASELDRLKYNANVTECPDKTLYKNTKNHRGLSGQNSLFDEPEAQSEPIVWQFETTQYEDAQRQIELIGYPAD